MRIDLFTLDVEVLSDLSGLVTGHGQVAGLAVEGDVHEERGADGADDVVLGVKGDEDVLNVSWDSQRLHDAHLGADNFHVAGGCNLEVDTGSDGAQGHSTFVVDQGRTKATGDFVEESVKRLVDVCHRYRFSAATGTLWRR